MLLAGVAGSNAGRPQFVTRSETRPAGADRNYVRIARDVAHARRSVNPYLPHPYLCHRPGSILFTHTEAP